MNGVVNIFQNSSGVFVSGCGEPVVIPEGWIFFPAGDALVTRKITACALCYRVQFKKGRRIMSKGVWAAAEIVEAAKREANLLRSSESYAAKTEYARKMREKKQTEYEAEFFEAVKSFLSFSPKYSELEEKMSRAVTDYCIAVGSGTVARTKMIPVGERAARAVIAWMRHKTSAYDDMVILRIKGMRREVRRTIARQSDEILRCYRRGESRPLSCPLLKALG